MQMKNLSLRLASILTGAFIVTACIISSIGAQAAISGPSTGSIRGAWYIPTSSKTHNTYGSGYLTGGLDIDFQDTSHSRNTVSVDYFEHSHGDNKLRVIPITLGTQTIAEGAPGSFRPIGGYGLGVYLLHAKQPGNSDFDGADTRNFVSYGGYAMVGLQFGSGITADVRYHLVQTVKNVDPSGFEFSLGIRF